MVTKKKVNVEEILATVTGADAIEIDRTYRLAWTALCEPGQRRPPSEVVHKLQEQHRKAHEAIVEKTSKSSGPKRDPDALPAKAEPIMEVLTKHFTEHGASVGLSEREIADAAGMIPQNAWYSRKKLQAQRKLRPVPKHGPGIQRYSIFPTTGPDGKNATIDSPITDADLAPKKKRVRAGRK